jgi:hypothetical protein
VATRGRKPTVIAEAEWERRSVAIYGGGEHQLSPGVSVRVEFALGTHEQALERLEEMVEIVKAQIADAAEGRHG